MQKMRDLEGHANPKVRHRHSAPCTLVGGPVPSNGLNVGAVTAAPASVGKSATCDPARNTVGCEHGYTETAC
jgi:hypothetical protein